MPCPYLGSPEDLERHADRPSGGNVCYAVEMDAERPLLSRLHPEAVEISLDHQARFCLSVEYPFCPRYLAYRRTQLATGPAEARLPTTTEAEKPAPVKEQIAAPEPSKEPAISPDPEALYNEGMTYYRARQWEEAQEVFARLKEVDPGRPGIDALLDELKLFIQLQEMETPSGEPHLEEEEAEALAAPPAEMPSAPRRKRFLSPAWLAAGVVVAALALFLGLHLAGVPILGGSQDERTELYNRGRALMVVGDYDGAIERFERLLAISPGNPEAQVELERAQRLKALSDLYTQAQDQINAGEWDDAAASLQQIMQLDSKYRDVASLAKGVARQQRLSSLYDEAKALYDQGNWVEAAAKFEELQALDADYRSSVVDEYLFVCYLNRGLALVVTSGDSIDQMKEAIRQFGAALGIHPRNKQAAEEQRLANLYLAGYASFQRQEWNQAILKVEQVFAARPDYAGGRAAQILCASYVALGDQAREQGDLLAALEYYRKVLEREDLQCPPAQERAQEILQILYPPTPTTAPSPTLLPPTPTPAATPTSQIVPPTPTPWLTPTYAPPTPTYAPPTPTRKPKPPTATPQPPTPTKKPTKRPTKTPKPPTPTPPR